MYQAEAFAKGQPAASPSTFFRTLRSSGWRHKLKFRHVSNHAQCQICQRLKSGIKHATTIQRHAKCADEYMRHLSGVFADRQAYMQYKWRAIHQRDVLTIMIDSMDRSKFKLPRFPYGRCPKALETRKRPDLEVTAAICHGRGVFVFVADEDAASGSDWSLEVLSLSLNKAFIMAQQSNEPWPSHLRLWTDNTPKERKIVFSFFHQVLVKSAKTLWTCARAPTQQEYRNSILGRYCCHLATSRAFMSVAHDHLVVGHTHEDVGFLHANQ